MEINNKCDDFEICSGNSDAECFVNDFTGLADLLNSIDVLCDRCVYNEKHKNCNSEDWEKYREEIGVPAKE